MPPRLKPGIKQAIMADLATGLTQRELAQKYDCCVRTITNMSRRLKTIAPDSVFASDFDTAKNKLQTSAVVRLQGALDTEPETPDIRMKAGTLATVTLKGTGFFTPDNQTTINAIVNGMPAEWLTDDPPYKPSNGE